MRYFYMFALVFTLLLSGVRVSYARELTAREVNAIVYVLQSYDLDSVKVEKIRGILEVNIPVQACLNNEKFSRITGELCNNIISDAPVIPSVPIKPLLTVPTISPTTEHTDGNQLCSYHNVYDNGELKIHDWICEPRHNATSSGQAQP